MNVCRQARIVLTHKGRTIMITVVIFEAWTIVYCRHFFKFITTKWNKFIYNLDVHLIQSFVHFRYKSQLPFPSELTQTCNRCFLTYYAIHEINNFRLLFGLKGASFNELDESCMSRNFNGNYPPIILIVYNKTSHF